VTEDFEPTNGEEFEEEVPVTEEPMMSGMEGVTDDDKLWAALAYVFTPLIPIILMLMEDKKARPYIKAHNMQALVWGVLNVIVSVTISPFLCGIPSMAMWLVALYWGWQAYQGQEITIPVITDMVKNQGWA
jgi:uncharacterized membrane protein